MAASQLDRPAHVIDRSHWDPITNWQALAGDVTAGFIDGLIGKVSDGTGSDHTWSANRDLSLRAGVPFVGGYHFHRWGVSPTANRDAFARNYGDPALCNMRPSIDCEDPAAPSGNQCADHLHATVDLFTAEFGVDPMIYTGSWWWVPHIGSTGSFAAALLIWLSGYTAHEPTAPTPWNRLPDMWQEKDNRDYPGIGPGDESVVTLSVLERIAHAGPNTPPIFPPSGDEPLSAQEVADIKAHIDEAQNNVIAYLTKVIEGQPGDSAPGVAAMVASMHHGDFGEAAGAVKGDLGWLDRHLDAAFARHAPHPG